MCWLALVWRFNWLRALRGWQVGARMLVFILLLGHRTRLECSRLLLSLLAFGCLGQVSGVSSALDVLPQELSWIGCLLYFQYGVVVYSQWQLHRRVVKILCNLWLVLVLEDFGVLRTLLHYRQRLLLLLHERDRQPAIRGLLFLRSLVAAAECPRVPIVVRGEFRMSL